MNREFRRLWASGGVSVFGSALSEVALPLIALFYAHASAVELGAVISVEQWAWLFIGLPAGVWVDRWSRVCTAVVADGVRAVLVAGVAVMALLGLAHVWLLLAVGLVVGVCTVFGDVAVGVLVPAVVEPEALIGANARMNSTQTAASLSGSTVVGPIVAVLGAPGALFADAITFAGSALLVRGIRAPRAARPPRTHFRRELADGVRIVLKEPLFRTLTIGSAAFNACTAAQYVMTFLLLRALDVPRAWYGVLLASAGVGALLGAVVLPRLTRRFGDAPMWRAAVVGGPVIGLAVPLAHPGWGLTWFVLGSFGLATAVSMSSVIGWSARQATCAPELLGRASATTRMLTWGLIPVGALLGGWLAHTLGIHAALWVVAGCFFAEPLVIRLTSVWHWPGVQPAQREGA